MSALPEEQEKLLRQLNSLETLERKGVLPERSNINLFVAILAWIIGLCFALLFIFRGNQEELTLIIIICCVISFPLISAYYNQSWGQFLSTIVILGINGLITYRLNYSYSELLVLLDALTVFVIANQYGRTGYISGLLIIGIKVSLIFIFTDQPRVIEQIIAITVNICILGIIPILLRSISATSRRAKKQEIRAEILSLQNQDLIGSWQSLTNYPPQNPLSNVPITNFNNNYVQQPPPTPEDTINSQ